MEGQPFLAVLGASGTGKSSLVKAGVLPRLQGQGPGVTCRDRGRQALLPRGRVLTASCRPCALPTSRCGRWRRCCALNWAKTLGLRRGSGDGDDALAQIVARWAAAHPGQRLVLTIDQFEELATLCRDDAERARFLRLLADGRPAATRRLPPDHHPAHRFRAAVHHA